MAEHDPATGPRRIAGLAAAAVAAVGWLFVYSTVAFPWALMVARESFNGLAAFVAWQVVETAPALAYFLAVGLVMAVLFGVAAGARWAALAAAIAMALQARLWQYTFPGGIDSLALAVLSVNYLLPVAVAVGAALIGRLWRDEPFYFAPADSRVVIPRNRGRTFLLFLGAMLFVVLGWSLWEPHERVIGPVIVIGFFGWIAIHCLFMLLDPRAALIIDGAGFTDRSGAAAVGRVEWKDVTGLSVTTVSNQDFVTVEVTDPRKYIARLGPVAALFARLNLSMFGSPVQIGANTLAIGFAELFDTLQSFHERSAESESRPRKGAVLETG
jgi:hypothetical protein